MDAPLLAAGKIRTQGGLRTRAALGVGALCLAMACLALASSATRRPDGRAALMEHLNDEQRDHALFQHNAYRCMHQDDALIWDEAIAARAQGWANILSVQNGCNMRHSRCDEYGRQSLIATGFCPRGENLAWGSHPEFFDFWPASFVDMWYAEEANYNWTSPGTKLVPSKPIAHFTQVVWRGTTRLGCGVAACGDAEVVVCQYEVRGNYKTQMADNVLPATKTKAECGVLSKPDDTCPPRASCPDVKALCMDSWSCNGEIYTCGTCQGIINPLAAPYRPPAGAPERQ